MSQTTNVRFFHLIFPEEKLVTETKILGWYADAVANGEVDDPECPEGFTVSVWEAIRQLEDAGLITVARGR